MGKPVYLKGKAKWMRPHVVGKYDAYEGILYLDDNELAKFRALKVMNQVKSDEDGNYIRVKRPVQKMMKGKVVGMGQPEVVDKEGKPFKEPIGNGSDVTVKLDYYPYKEQVSGIQKHAIRWDAVRVDNLVPFVKEDFTEDEKKKLGEVSDQPEPLF